MFFALLLLEIHSEEDKVQQLTTQGFRDVILKRDDSETFLVLFTGYHSSLVKRVKKAQNEFNKAIKLIGDTVHYATVNLTQEPFLSARLGITVVPDLKIYYPSGTDTFHKKFTASNIVDFVSDKLPNYVNFFDRKWVEDEMPSVVLFTDQIKIPTIWSSLSMKFRDQFIRFGICSEFHIHAEFQVARLPTVLFFNQSNQIRYRGDFNEQSLALAIESFLNNTLAVDNSLDDEGFYRFNEFEDQCHGRDFCILHTGGDISDQYRQIRVMSRRTPMKFFYGAETFPINGMKADRYYIWNPRRKAIIEANTIDDLPGTLDRVIDGGARWTKIADFQKAAGINADENL